MLFRAISIGHAVPRRDFEAVVHSVFDSVVNLELSEASQLLTLLSSGDTDLPQGIRLASPPGFDFEGLSVGTAALCRNHLLRFNGCPLRIDLQGAACWDEEPPAARADMSNPVVRDAWGCAWQALNEQQSVHAAGLVAQELWGPVQRQPAWVREAGSCLRAIVAATRRCAALPGTGLRRLIGLGPGLTPSGDDLVVGYLIGMRCAAQGRQDRLDFLARLAGSVLGLSTQTGDISRTYLFHAAHGSASSVLRRLAEAICSGASASIVRTSAAAAMQVGHTSGMEAVTGLLVGLAAWDAPELLSLA